MPKPPPRSATRGRPSDRVAAPRGEGGEPLNRLGLGVEVGELRTHVHMEAEHVDSPRESVGEQRLRLVWG